MRNYFTIDNITSKSKGLYISGGATYNSPNRKLNFVTVVGKNGDIILDDGQYENIQITYPAFMIGVTAQTMEERTRNIANWLRQYKQYVKILDTYKPNYYRMGVPSGAIDWELAAAARVAETTLAFNCKPQLFFVSGDTEQTFSSNGTITNPSIEASKPLLRVYGSGSGTLIIGNYRLDIMDIVGYVDINTEVRYAYKGNQNLNEKVTAADAINYMQIDSGAQSVQMSGGVTSVKITPKWWTT